MSSIDGLVQVAQDVVKAVSGILPFPISLSDRNGRIIGASDPERIGTYHLPSKEILQHKGYIAFEKDKVTDMNNVLPGIGVSLQFNNETIGVLGIIGPPSKVKPHAELIKQHVEILWKEKYRKQTEELKAKTLETFLQYILLNDSIDPDKVRQYSRMMNIDEQSTYHCIIINIDNSLITSYEAHSKPLLINNLRSNLLNHTIHFLGNGTHDVCAFLSLEKIVVLKSINYEHEFLEMMKSFERKCTELIEVFKTYGIHHLQISISHTRTTLFGIHESFQEAEYLLSQGKILNKERHIFSYHDWDILLELLPKQVNDGFINKIKQRLIPLYEDHNYLELKKNFMTYCDNNMNISESAKKLYIHRNTLIYRLNKISELTSLDTRNFHHCTLLYMIFKHIPDSLMSSHV